MPLYEYECSSCGAGFETFQSISENLEDPPTHCPNCDPDEKEPGTLFKFLGHCRPALNIQGEGVFRRGWQ